MKSLAIIWDLNGVLFKQMVLDESTIGIVRRLNEEGVAQYICTNTMKWKLDEWVEEYRLREIFKDIFSVNEMGLLKNDSKVYREILKNIKEDEVFFIDDSEDNLLAAQEVGIKGVLYKSDEDLLDNLKLLGIYK